MRTRAEFARHMAAANAFRDEIRMDRTLEAVERGVAARAERRRG